MIPWKPGLYTPEQIPESAYHRDDFGDVPTLSRSTAAELVNDSPADAWDHHPRLGGIPKRKVTEEMEWASLVHSLILGSGPRFEVLPAHFGDYRKDTAKAIRDNARDQGVIPMLAKDHDLAQTVARRLIPQVEEWVSGQVVGWSAQAEVTVLWEEPILEVDDCPSCGGGGSLDQLGMVNCSQCEGVGKREVVRGLVRCRSRLDLWVPEHFLAPTIIDLKIVEKCTGTAFERSMEAHGTDMQAASYIRAIERTYPELAGRVLFKYLLCRNDGRYVVQVTPTRAMLELGQRRWDRGKAMWASCLSKGLASQWWPGPEPREAAPTSWQIQKELEIAMSEGDDDGSDA